MRLRIPIGREQVGQMIEVMTIGFVRIPPSSGSLPALSQLFAEISKNSSSTDFHFASLLAIWSSWIFHPCGKVVVHQFRKGFFEDDR